MKKNMQEYEVIYQNRSKSFRVNYLEIDLHMLLFQTLH